MIRKETISVGIRRPSLFYTILATLHNAVQKREYLWGENDSRISVREKLLRGLARAVDPL